MRSVAGRGERDNHSHPKRASHQFKLVVDTLYASSFDMPTSTLCFAEPVVFRTGTVVFEWACLCGDVLSTRAVYCGLAVMKTAQSRNLKPLHSGGHIVYFDLAVPSLHPPPLITTSKVERRHCSPAQSTTYADIPRCFGEGPGRKVTLKLALLGLDTISQRTLPRGSCPLSK